MTLHFVKLAGRSLMFIAATVLYILDSLGILVESTVGRAVSVFVTCIFTVEMLLRFFPSKYESMGCQKQFKRNNLPKESGREVLEEFKKQSRRHVIIIGAIWIGGNAVFGVLHLTGILDMGFMLVLSLFYSVCDMICILFYCPFQSLIMKNRCCVSCRIYNWDYAMMFTPLVFVSDPCALCLCSFALALLLRWEISYKRAPESFCTDTNACLECSSCNEKLCRHKKAIRRLVAEHTKRFTKK